ncbi:hypothetical protein F1880_006674 [Penicillium rolfsii]|nr:hypothetical protein F1880_006674 [Penicillium rolfsii]
MQPRSLLLLAHPSPRHRQHRRLWGPLYQDLLGTATSKGAGTSTSTGGVTGATEGLAMGIAGAAGILELALALEKVDSGGIALEV